MTDDGHPRDAPLEGGTTDAIVQLPTTNHVAVWVPRMWLGAILGANALDALR